MRKIGVVVCVIGFFSLVGCTATTPPIRDVSEFPELRMSYDGSELRYRMTTYQYRGNEIGEVQDISGYRIHLIEKPLENGSLLYHFYRIETAQAKPTVEELQWIEFSNIREFKVIVAKDLSLDSVQEYLLQIPHDDISTYDIYVSLMDLIMYKNYARLVVERQRAGTLQFQERPMKSKAPDWIPIVTDVEFEDTGAVFTYVGNNIENERVFYYKNDGTKIKQNMHLSGLDIPSKGTTRFMGFLYITEGGIFRYGILSEYFSMEVWPLFFMKMNMLVRREQVIELI